MHRRPNATVIVGWGDGADRASHDADVSITLPKIPYGGFSPVRLQGQPIRCDLPTRAVRDRERQLPACPTARDPFVATLRTPPPAEEDQALSPGRSRVSACRCASGRCRSPPGVLGSGASCVVSPPQCLLRPHPSVSRARDDFAAWPVIRRAFAVRERLGDPRDLPYFHCRAVHTCHRPYAGGSAALSRCWCAPRCQASSVS